MTPDCGLAPWCHAESLPDPRHRLAVRAAPGQVVAVRGRLSCGFGVADAGVTAVTYSWVSVPRDHDLVTPGDLTPLHLLRPAVGRRKNPGF